MHTLWLTALVAVVVFDGLGFAAGFLIPLYTAFKSRVLPVAGGIHLLDGGPFKSLGFETLLVLGLVFVVVSALKLLAAFWLWQARQDGAILELILLGLSAIFWYGFALPFGPPLGGAQVVLMALVWGGLYSVR